MHEEALKKLDDLQSSLGISKTRALDLDGGRILDEYDHTQDTNELKKKILEGDDSDDDAEKQNKFLNVYDESKNTKKADEDKDTTLAEVKIAHDQSLNEEQEEDKPAI